jgi:hypothetical protein
MKKAKCWWFDPSDGKAMFIGTYKNSGFHNFIPESEGDCVLILDFGFDDDCTTVAS